MNKKFSTLLVSALLAGGLFSTVNAIDLRDAKPGQYYKLKRTAEWVTDHWTAPTEFQIVSRTDGTIGLDLTNTIDDESAYWTIETRAAATGTNVRFVNVKTGKALKLSNATASSEWFNVKHWTGTIPGVGAPATASGDDANEITWGSDQYLSIEETTSGNWQIVSATSSATGKYAQAIEAVPVRNAMSIEKVNLMLRDGFGLQVGYLKDGKYDKFNEYSLQGAEALQGTLIATDNIDGKDVADNAKTEFKIWNADKKAFVVLLKEKWSSIGTDLNANTAGKGYKWALMTSKEIQADNQITPASDRKIASYVFTIAQSLHADNTPLEVVAKDAYSVTGVVTGADAELFVAEVNGTCYLTTNKVKYAGNPAALTDGDADLIPDFVPNTFVRFGLSNYLNVEDFYGYAVTVEGVNNYGFLGKTIQPNSANAAIWVSTDYVAMTQPEGQWIVTNDGGDIKWKNRETAVEATNFFNGLRHVSGDVYVDANGQQYALTKTDALGGNSFAYYGEYEANNEAAGEPRSYKISFYNKTSDEYNYVGQNARGEMVLTNKVANAVIFDLKKVVKTNDLKANGKLDENKLTDVVYYTSDAMVKNNEGKWVFKEKADTVSFYRYRFVSELGELTLGDGSLRFGSSGDYFIIKKKDNGTVNILNAGRADYDSDWNATQGFNNPKYDLTKWGVGRAFLNGTAGGGYNTPNAQMLYFDNNHALLKQQPNIYRWEANAQLVIDDKSTVTYRTLDAHKNYEFFRTEFSDEFLFERGEFLGMTTNRFDYNPAIFVDTAYVRNETVKPLYMLAVGVDQTPESTYCPIHGTEPCDHALDVPGNIAARYLVSYTDSVAKNAELLQNPFCYTNTKLTKLGFVPAIHKVDTVFVVENGEAVKRYELGEQKVTPMTFAFRIVNPETEEFVIETGRLANENYALASWNTYRTAWIKWHNGCPVLTNNIDEAEVFNVRSTEAEATANEAVAAEVSVVAAQGAIIVKGAAGKVVTVANILGQTIANQVAASDNVTIAAPAGIAVVTVDGEATKVVVK